MPDVTQILSAIEGGDPQAAEQLLPLVYEELRKLAAAKLAHEKAGQTLDATGLVHEAYVRLVASRGRESPENSPRADAPGSPEFANRAHFFAAAAEAMRRILVDRARARHAAKRGGHAIQVPLSDYADSDADERLLHLDEALSRLARDDPVAAKVVELHHFAGLNQIQTAEALATTEYQVRQKWAFARAWLKAALTDS
jgi:RNA polymerase sigma factor (TIGR02999 family)